MNNQYQVIVGNVGTVYSGSSRRVAWKEFQAARVAATGPGRDSGEPVTLTCNGEPVAESVTYEYEYTDTYAGEANYCWVNRGTVHATSFLEATRLAKLAVGINGVKCNRDYYGDMVVLKPRHMATVLFVQ